MKKYKLVSIAIIPLILTLAGCGKKEEAETSLDTGASNQASTSDTTATQLATATLKGKVTLDGTAPAREKIAMDADAYCKANHADTVFSDSVVVNPGGTLQYVFVYVKEGISGKYPALKDPVVFDQRGCMYSPHVLGVRVDQPFKILNSDETLHNVHALPEKSTQFNLAMPFKGMELSKKFTKPEIMVKIKCDVHPWMAAYVGVLSHPFFAVSGADGTFQLPKLPAGTYTLEAWHEKFGTQTQSVTLGDNETKDISFTFKA